MRYRDNKTCLDERMDKQANKRGRRTACKQCLSVAKAYKLNPCLVAIWRQNNMDLGPTYSNLQVLTVDVQYLRSSLR